MFSHSELTRALAAERLGRPLHYFPSIGSTNDEAKRLAAEGAPEGTLVVADEQTAGRGRGRRRWISPAGTDMALTFVLRPSLPASQLGHLALLGGVAAVQAIEEVTGLEPKLKWPNDVWIGGKKVCGVLAESSIAETGVEWAVLGIGINVNGGPPPDAVAGTPATVLAREIGQSVDRLPLLVNLARTLAALYPNLGSQALLDVWERYMLWRGERVRASSNTAVQSGILLGLTSDGALRLRQADQREIIVSATSDVRLF